MRWKPLVLVLSFALVPFLASADYLEVRRGAAIYKEPSRRSAEVTRIELKDRDGPYLVRLLQDSKVNGYYKIRLPGKPAEGWIYKTFVRRYSGQHPRYQTYKRSLYEHWIDEDGDCRDTRAEVLIRDDDDGIVEFKTGDNCVVMRGTWTDPYTGETIHDVKQVDVDHVVPLKNAHESGAWTWSAERRRQYANYLGYPMHLLAVKASENRGKGSKGPDQYLPPLKSFHCEYARIWVRIKQDWELEMSEPEGEAVEKVLAACPDR